MVATALQVAGGLAAIATLLILTYEKAKPAINRWATIRFLRVHSLVDPEDIFASERALSFFELLMTREQRNRQLTMIHQLHQVKNLADKNLRTAKCDPLIVRAVVSSRRRRMNRENRRRKRIHKGLLCDGGCGTRFGKRRHDHNFYEGVGIKGGWFCPSHDSCQKRPTGEHYCGMCHSEVRAPSIPIEHQEAENHSPDTESENFRLSAFDGAGSVS